MSTPTQNQEAQIPTPDAVKQAEKEHNFSQFKKLMEKKFEEEQQARMKLEQELKAARQPNRSDDDDDNDDEPYVDKRKLNKVLAKFEEKFDKKVDEKAEQKARMLIHEERKESYLRENNDFQQVLQSENIQRFAEKHPNIAKAMLNMPDTFERQQLLYEQIKAMGMHKKEEPKIQDTINKNLKSPYYRPTSESSPPYAAMGDFSEGGQKNAYQKMQELIKNKRAM
jgi:hypothetical protein